MYGFEAVGPETIGEPGVNLFQYLSGFVVAVLREAQSRQAHCGTQLPGRGLLTTGKIERSQKGVFRPWVGVFGGLKEREFSEDA